MSATVGVGTGPVRRHSARFAAGLSLALALGLVAIPDLGADAPGPEAPQARGGAPDLRGLAAGFHELFIHDECTGGFTPQPDTCLHSRVHEKTFTFGGSGSTVYDVTLRVRGLFEPTTIEGGETPSPAHPYLQRGGRTRTADYSHWYIEVSDPKQTYTLNHYPRVSHTIYKEDFEVTIPIAAGAAVAVRVVDANDRQIDNGAQGRADRLQILEGVTDTARAGQMLRLDVLRVVAR